MNLSWEQEELSNIPFAVFRGAEAAINTIRFTKDQSQFLAASDDTNTTLWDVETGRALAYYGHNAPALKSVENNEDVILCMGFKNFQIGILKTIFFSIKNFLLIFIIT